ncbi:hypothetical protein M422DRAFT_785424 [Sphaerobolus stellatus SS14]|uniref:Unplaced genomic scaffold SPHSTscaffold_324, whole genome shotgun sequence n=1 Tax=Sphaerobolus stellatus (strain SS14) TaxID=990650 RepID=A0A0C9UKJ2_SPHS4|nr:hypothetical protein M422DRAFT_785424 [Sphaerobolus stellatus SS14]
MSQVHRKAGLDLVKSPLEGGLNITFEEFKIEYPFMFRLFSNESYISLNEDKDFVAPISTLPSTEEEERKSILKEILWARSSTPYVAASTSLMYIVNEAYRRHGVANQTNVRVAIISTADFGNEDAFVVLDRLHQLRILDTPHQLEINVSEGDVKKSLRFANSQATILIKRSIPRRSIKAVISYLDLMNLMPPYIYNAVEGKPRFTYEERLYRETGQPQSRRSNGELVEATRNYEGFGVSTDKRIEYGCKLGIGILKAQNPAINLNEEEYEELLALGAWMTEVFVYFPCKDDQEAERLFLEIRNIDFKDKVDEILAAETFRRLIESHTTSAAVAALIRRVANPLRL